MKAAEILRQESTKFRLYELSSDVYHAAKQTIAKYEKRYPDEAWGVYLQPIGDDTSNDSRCLTKPIVRWSAADTSIFRERWGVTLPNWMEEFYSEVTCALLPMLNPISILTPQESVEREEMIREATGELHLPYRCIRFADATADGAGFSLRQRLKDDSWHIICTSIFSYEEYQSMEWEDYQWDADINDWMQRMFDTDGHPVMRGNHEYESMRASRLG